MAGQTVHEGEALSVTEDGGVAEVELVGPGKGNAMGPSFWRELPGVFDALDREDDVRAVIIFGRGDHFSYGLDLKAMMSELGPHLAGEQLAKQRTDLLDLIRRYQSAVSSIERCRKPVIAAMHGWCIGGAIDVASACDVRLASRDAKLSVREVKVAIVADLGTLQRLPRIVGHGVARELAFTGKDVDAEHAKRIGLVNDVYDDRDGVVEAARAMGRDIASNAPLVVQGIKRVMTYGADRPVQDGLEYVAAWNSAFLQSKDLAEAMQAFAERRDPDFKGE